jgi:hypothetical protein
MLMVCCVTAGQYEVGPMRHSTILDAVQDGHTHYGS